MEKEIVDLIVRQLSRQVLKKIIEKIPLFGSGIFGYFASKIVFRLVGLVVNYTDLGLSFLQIEKTKREQSEKFKEDARKLKEAQDRGDQDEIDRVEKETEDSFRDFINLRPKRP